MLPIVPVKDVDEAIAIIRAKCVALSFSPLTWGVGSQDVRVHTLTVPRPHPATPSHSPTHRDYPLAVYVFSNDPKFEKKGACMRLAPVPGAPRVCVYAVLTE